MAERWSSLQGRWKEPTTVHLPVSMKPLSMTHSCTEALEEYFPIARYMWGRIIATWLSPWHYWKWITLQRKENDIRARFYPTCIRESANLICPGGNHLSESKWCHVVNAWNTRDPPRATLAKTTTMWKQAHTLRHVVAMPTPTYLLSDSLGKYGKQEDGSNGWHQVTQDWLHEFKQLFTAFHFNHRDPDDGSSK